MGLRTVLGIPVSIVFMPVVFFYFISPTITGISSSTHTYHYILICTVCTVSGTGYCVQYFVILSENLVLFGCYIVQFVRKQFAIPLSNFNVTANNMFHLLGCLHQQVLSKRLRLLSYVSSALYACVDF